MLLYSNLSLFRVALQLSGSVLFQPSTAAFVLLLTGANVAVQFLIEHGPRNMRPSIPNNYAVATLGMVVAFASVFRTNLAWQRYWESLSQVHYMYSKCTDAFSAYAAFTKVTAERARKKGNQGRASRVEQEYQRVHNYFSWMSALAVDRINHGCTNRMDIRRKQTPWRDQVITLQELRRCEDTTGSTKLPALHVGSVEQQRTVKSWEHSFVVSALPSDLELKALDRSEDRVQVIVTWIIGSLSHLSEDLDIPPPIQSRIYQEISNAMVGFENCVKIADVPFPFPYAQLLCILVLAFAVITPVAVACFTRSYILGPMFTMLVSSAIWCVNEVAKQLENPFGMDENDINLEDLHASFIGVLEETAEVLDVQTIVRNSIVPKVEQVGETVLDPHSPLRDGHDTPEAVNSLRRENGRIAATASKPTTPLQVVSAEPFRHRTPMMGDNQWKNGICSSTKHVEDEAEEEFDADILAGTMAKERYLPTSMNGKQVLIHEGGQSYRADNRQLKAPAAGLTYRRSKNLHDKDPSPAAVCLWGASVDAADVGDGWVQVSELRLPSSSASERIAGSEQALNVIDSQLAEISLRMEVQLAQIAKELSVLPSMCRRGTEMSWDREISFSDQMII